VIRTLLVANRGEIAVRVMRAARALGMRTVAVYAPPDAGARHVREADRAVAIGSYLDADAILAVGADAVHPGYGFLAENAGFAQRVLDAGRIWVGPPPHAIRTMGDKLAALETVARAGVPTLPRGEEAGFPLMVKAAAGGGGKGMRIVRDPAELPAALESARREAMSAFGDDTVFVERYVEGARHIEVQVFGDAHGHVRHLFERECSIQRRHQKIIEEAPSPFVDAALRERIGAVAVAAAAAVGYAGAGTVELIMGADRSFFFLEMNTRLQVEHPVTELVTGIDLVRQQLLVAQGLAPEFDDVVLRGAAIEARVYAEDADFLPQSGTLLEWHEPGGVRVDSGVARGDTVTPHYDPLLAKVIAHGATRHEAAAKLSRALRELRAHGVETNRQFLIDAVEHEAFLAGDTTVDFVSRVPRSAPSDEQVRRAALAAALHDRPRGTPIPPGWGHPTGGERYLFRHGSRELSLRLRARDATVDGTEMTFDGDVIDGVRERFTVTRDGDRVWVHTLEREVVLTEVPRFPPPEAEVPSGSLVAPMNGSVVAVEVGVGDSVEAGQTLLVLEAMKMEHRITAPVAGTVTELRAAAGDTVVADAVLAVVQA
jgi:propionyl-CoA carboxylase alpha chain